MMAQEADITLAGSAGTESGEGRGGVVLRALLGPMAGAEARLDRTAEKVSVGHDLSADIVIRAPGFEGTAFEIAAIDETAAEITVLSGEVRLGAFTLEPGVPALVPPFVPIFSGDTAIAIGLAADEGRWAAAEALAARQSRAEGLASPVPLQAEPRRKRQRKVEGAASAEEPRRLPWGAALAGLGAGAVLVFLVLMRQPEPAPAPVDPAARLAAVLEENGYEELAVSIAATGELGIMGTLPSAARKAELEGFLAARGIRAHVNVTTEEKLLRQVEDVFRMNGVTAVARRGEDGVVIVETALAPSARLSAIKAQIAQDLPSAARIEVVSEEAPMPPPSVGAPDPRQRIVSVQGGSLGYLSTQGGDRLYPGATLSTGHRIKKIAGKTVTVEIGDQETVLTF